MLKTSKSDIPAPSWPLCGFSTPFSTLPETYKNSERVCDKQRDDKRHVENPLKLQMKPPASATATSSTVTTVFSPAVFYKFPALLKSKSTKQDTSTCLSKVWAKLNSFETSTIVWCFRIHRRTSALASSVFWRYKRGLTSICFDVSSLTSLSVLLKASFSLWNTFKWLLLVRLQQKFVLVEEIPRRNSQKRFLMFLYSVQYMCKRNECVLVSCIERELR